MWRTFGAFSLCVLLGCNEPVSESPGKAGGPSAPPAATAAAPAASETVTRIRRLVGKHLEIPIEKVSAEKTFADLGADDLDLVEIVMEAEEEFEVAMGDAELLPQRLTIAELARLVEKAKKSP